MKISTITITNMAGLEHFTTALSGVSIIEGPHGSGKSSIERSVMYAMGRRPLATPGSKSVQHDPKMLRNGQTNGETLVTFSEDSDVEMLRCRIWDDADKGRGTDRKNKVRGKKSWEDAGPFIDEITNALAYDPMKFKDLSEKERLEAFLRVVPVEISADEVSAAVGGAIPMRRDEKPGLDTINSLYDDIYKARAAANAAADTQGKYADNLFAALPPQIDSTWAEEAKRLRGDKATLETSEAEEIARVALELQGKKEAAAEVARAAELALNMALTVKVAEINDQIRDLEIKRARLGNDNLLAVSVLNLTESESNEAAKSVASTEEWEIKTANEPRHTELAAAIATAEERARAMDQATGTKAAAEKARTGAAEHKSASAEMTAALERINTLKATVAGRMTVKGVTIAAPREGMAVDICRLEKGALVPFSTWNDADKDQFCLKMAILHRGTCGIVCIDNLANWSPERQARIIEQCKKYAASDGMQFLLGRVTTDGSPLRVVEA